MKQSGINRQVIRAVLLAALLCLSATAQPQTITGSLHNQLDPRKNPAWLTPS